MRQRRLGVLVAALAAACFDDPIPVEPTVGMDGTAADTGTAGPEPTATATGPVTDTEPPPTTTAPTTTSTSADGTATSEESTTGEPIPIECGDGMPAPGELCFDDSTVLMANDSTFGARIGDVSGMPARDVVHLITDQVVVRVGNGDGNFGPAVFDASVVGQRFELADFDGDGELDMALAESSGALRLLRGSGAGSFSSADQVVTGGGAPQALAVGHLDADASLDAVLASGATVYTVLGDGSGGISAGPSYSTVGAVMGLSLADLDGDDRTDLVLTVDGGGWQGVALRRGVGDGAFEEQEATSGTMPGARGLATGDFDGDGTIDVAYASQAMDALGVLLGTGGGGFAAEIVVATGSGPQVLHAADLDGNGRTELVVGHQGETTLRIYTVASDDTVSEALQIPLAAAATAIDSGDVSGDGVPDLAATSTTAEIVTVVLSTP